jgi:ppGpp synthetase/RelA/SpoT-type nucleotidyltranferase
MTSRNTKPEYSKERVNRAGNAVRAGIETAEDILVIENWRAAHNKILNDWQASLRGRCQGKEIVFAQRLKRRATIFDKLKRQPDMHLSRMHDIAGCRLIFGNLEQLNEYREALHKSWMKHVRRKANSVPYPYDYIANPHPDESGYRGIHDIYQYSARPGRDTAWNNLQVEIQYRTKAQHAWATANEIAGSITGNHSKFDRGDERQKEFFCLASEVISRSEENLTSCYPSIDNQDLVQRFLDTDSDIRLLSQLRNLRIASETHDLFKQNIILVHSDKNENPKVYSYDTLPAAQIKYFQLEKEMGNTHDIVLVRAPSQENLRQAYKNYFSDTKDFTRLIDTGLQYLRQN